MTSPWVPRVPRPSVSRNTPLHVTLRARDGTNLRDFPCRMSLQEALRQARGRFGLKVIHYSIQKNHLHLIVERSGSNTGSRPT